MSEENDLAPEGDLDVSVEESAEAPEPAASDELEASSPEIEDSPAEETEQTVKSEESRRIGELAWKQREAERIAQKATQEAEYWRQQAQKPDEVEPDKTLADFDYDEDAFRTHLFDQATKRAEKAATEAARREIEQDNSQREQQARQQAYLKREQEYAGTLDDYWDVARSDSVIVNQDMYNALIGSEHGPAILYYLGKNLDIADSISRLPVAEAAMEIGKIEARLTSQKPATVTKAPPPPSQIKGLDPVINKNPDDMTQAEFNAHRRKVIAQRRR